MSIKTANLYARIEPDLKEQAESILSALGISASGAINMFYKQIVLHRGMPFEVVLPGDDRPVSFRELTDDEISAEIEKGYEDIRSGNVLPAKQAFSEIHDSLDSWNTRFL